MKNPGFWVAYAVSIFFFLIGTDLNAQQRTRPSEEEMKQIRAAKASFITNRLNITAEQSEKFWPVYNEFDGKRREIRREQRKIMNEKRKSGTVDEQALNNIREVQDLKQQELDLEGEYQSRFLKVISPSQLEELYKAEKTFNDMLLQRLRREGGN